MIIVLAGILGFVMITHYWGEFSGKISSGIVTYKLNSKPGSFEIRADKNAKVVYSMELVMSGKINGTGILCVERTDSTCLRADTISDKFNVIYHGDWYSDNCIVRYKPITSTKGELIMDYKIFSFRRK
ncbi:MAG: hypothetical protein WCR72_05390 [Bacteroidota bacterium]